MTLTLLITFILTAFAPASALSLKEPVETLERLDDAANILMRVSDANGPSLCGLRPEEARKLILPLHSMLDRKLEKLPRNKNTIPFKSLNECESSCHCGLYGTVYEKRPNRKLSRAERRAYKNAATKATKQGAAELNRCTDKNKWFCESELLKYLKQETFSD